MVHGDTKCFSQGSQEPALENDQLTLYSHRFCPYAERTRLILSAKDVPYRIVNINLKSKPDWFLKRTPLAMVPVIEEASRKRIVYESLIVCEYLDDTIQGKVKMLPVDPYQRAQQKMLIEVIAQKFIATLTLTQFKGGNENFQAMLKGMSEVEDMLTSSFFAGSVIGYVDLMVWPWFQRMTYIKQSRGFGIPQEKFPKIFAWVERMHKIPFVNNTEYPVELIAQFAEGNIAGRPNYDIGLET